MGHLLGVCGELALTALRAMAGTHQGAVSAATPTHPRSLPMAVAAEVTPTDLGLASLPMATTVLLETLLLPVVVLRPDLVPNNMAEAVD